MLKVKKRPDSPFWHIVGTVKGQRVRQSTCTTDKATAEAEAAYLEARLRREQLYGKDHETTFADAALAYIKSKAKDSKPVCSPQYLKTMVQRYGRRTLASFSPGEIRDIAQAVHARANPATRNRHGIAPFMAVYNHAVARKLAPPLVVERFKEYPAKTVSVTRGWIEAVRSQMKDPHARAMVRLMFDTGMRLGTAVALSPSMLDARACVIRVPGNLLKNGEPHDFILTSELAIELASLPPIKTAKRDNSRMFGFVYGSGFYKHLKRACALAGMSYVPPHQSGRHSFATVYLVDEEVDPVTVAELGGWKDVSMLMKRYPHAREAKLRSVVERISGTGYGSKLKRVK